MLKPSQIRSIRDFFGQCTVGFGTHFSPCVSWQTVEQWETGKLPMLRHQVEQILPRAAVAETGAYDYIEQAQELYHDRAAKQPLICVGFLCNQSLKAYDPPNYKKFLGSNFVHNVAIHNADLFFRKNPTKGKVVCNPFIEKSYQTWLQRKKKEHSPDLLPVWAKDDMGLSRQECKLLPDELSAKLQEIDQVYREPSPPPLFNPR